MPELRPLTMKRVQRMTWIDRPGFLCCYCRYADWHKIMDRYDGTEDVDVHCQHHLEAVRENVVYMEPGNDCWGFRPKKRTENV